MTTSSTPSNTLPSRHYKKLPPHFCNKTLCIFVSLLKKTEAFPGIIDYGFLVFTPQTQLIGNSSGENMELLAALNLEPIFQLTFVGLIMIAGPVVIFLLAFRGGDL